MAVTTTTIQEQRLQALWETPETLYGKLATVDHKEIGWRYVLTAIAFLLVGGIEALVMRVQLARPELGLLSPEAYNQMFTMHGTTMIYWYALPILTGFSVFLAPLMIGARDLAFPRLNAFTYWTFLTSGLLLYGGAFIAQLPHGGWFSYVPFTNNAFSPGYGMDFFTLSLILFTISSTGAAVNFIVTILRHRAPGMAISRMPLLMYSTFTISVVSLFAMPALAAATGLLYLDRNFGTHFYNAALGGEPLLWQQLFWFFGHPWVYIIFLPATGMISMLLPVFCRRPIVGYTYVALATVLTGLVGFGVWIHHMFAVGASHMSMTFFSAASMTISIFTAVQVFAWVATMWTGRPIFTASMHYAVGFISLLVIGGLNGIVTAVIPVDWQIHDTYFVVSHLHYVLVGANMFPVFAALYYWWPKMTGRMANETLGKISFWTMFIGINLTFFPMHLMGIAGMPRRIYTYPEGLGWEWMNMVSTIGAYILAVGIFISLWNFVQSYMNGKKAGKNPWAADTLEWSTDSPPPPYGSVHLPTVVSRHPLWDDHDEEADPGNRRVLDRGRFTFSTSWLDGEPRALARMPEESIVPLIASLTLTAVFIALVVDALWVAAVFTGISLAAAAYWLWPKRVKVAVR